MRSFLSKFTFKIDAKGRVSIPAAFRTTLVEFGSKDFLAFASPTARSIHCVTSQLVEQLTASIDPLAAFGAGAARRRLMGEHQIEVVGEKLRAMMPWIKANKLVDKSRN